MEPKLHHNVDATKQSESAQELRVKLNGAMSLFAGRHFMGRNVPIIADACSDVTVVDPTSGHYLSMYSWTFNEKEADLEAVWTIGYDVAHNLTMAIIDGNQLLEKAKKELATDPKNQEKLYEVAMTETTLSQMYTLKAYTYFYLVNLFGKVYNDANKSTFGLILIPNDRVIKPKEKLKRATVEETYNEILALLKKAQELKNLEKTSFYPNPVSIKAFEAKVYLYKKDWKNAIASSEEAIKAGVKPVEEAKDYYNIWTTLSESPEVLFTLKKTSDDNLSANSLNNFYGGYKATVSQMVLKLFKEKDYRKALIAEKMAGRKAPHPRKFDGTTDGMNVNNVPILRASEVYLNAAEAYLEDGNEAKAKEMILAVAKRDADIASIDKLPSGKEELKKFISEERIREFFTEGYRFFDLRRMELKATINGAKDYQLSTFVFPLPDAETRAGFLDKDQTNRDWNKNLPKPSGK